MITTDKAVNLERIIGSPQQTSVQVQNYDPQADVIFLFAVHTFVMHALLFAAHSTLSSQALSDDEQQK